MHCPGCNALNPDDAKFCSLCLRRLESQESTAEEEMPLVRMPEESVETQRAWELAGTAGPPSVSEVISGPIKKTQEGVSWFCPNCDTENPISANRCRVCGSSFFDAFRPPEPGAAPIARNPNIAGFLSAIPGLGHMYLGKMSDGITRSLLAVWWIGFSVLLPAVTPILLGTKVIFILASIVLAGMSVLDAYRLAQDPNSKPLFDRRWVFFGSLALFVLTMIAVVSTGIVART